MPRARARPVLSRQSSVLRVGDGVARLILPQARIDVGLAQALCAAVERIELDESVRVALLATAGRDFCLGVADRGDWEQRHDWVAAIGRLTVPVVAAIGGDAIAEGCELALACDLRIAAAGARLALPQLADGRLPSHGATQRLPRLIGRTRALDLLLSGRRVGGSEAARIGLVSRLVPAGRLDAAVRDTVQTLCARGPVALRLAKEAVNRGVDLTLEQGIRFEQDLYVLLQTTTDRAAGVRAFLQKRRPRFRNT
jgi:enoyl-CoA hydratase